MSHETHPFLADLPIFDEEIAAIAESIREVGLLHPVTLDTEGRVIGGRHRLAACARAGVEPAFEVFDGDPLAFVLHDNATRKHQTTGQRAAEVALALANANRRERGRWAYGKAKEHLSDLKDSRLSQAGFILDHLGRDAVVSIAIGELALDSAYRDAEKARDADRLLMEEQQRLAAEEDDARTFLEERAPAMLAEVGSKFGSHRQAKTAWEDENRREAAAERQRRAEKERAERDRASALTHTYTDIAQAVQCLAAFGSYDDPLTIMRDFETRFVNPPQLMKEFSRERLQAVSRFSLALIDYMEGGRS